MALPIYVEAQFLMGKVRMKESHRVELVKANVISEASQCARTMIRAIGDIFVFTILFAFMGTSLIRASPDVIAFVDGGTFLSEKPRISCYLQKPFREKSWQLLIERFLYKYNKIYK